MMPALGLLPKIDFTVVIIVTKLVITIKIIMTRLVITIMIISITKIITARPIDDRPKIMEVDVTGAIDETVNTINVR